MKTKKRSHIIWPMILSFMLLICSFQIPVIADETAAETTTVETETELQSVEDVSDEEAITENADTAEAGNDERDPAPADIDVETNAEIEPDAGANADIEPDACAHAEIEPDAGANADIEPDVDANAETEADLFVDTDAGEGPDTSDDTEYRAGESVSTSAELDAAENVNRIIHIQDGTSGGTVVLGVNGRNTYQLQLRIFYDQSTSYEKNESYYLFCESDDDDSVIARVDQSGLVTALAPGKFTVYARTERGTWNVRMFEIRETVYQVTLDLNGGAVTEDENYKYGFSTIHLVNGGETIDVSPKKLGYHAIERPGYVFEGWTLKKDGNTILEGEYKPSANVTLYAKWKKLCEVRVDLNGGNWCQNEEYNAEAYGDPRFYDAGDSFWFPQDNDFSRNGYVFQGWTTKKDGDELIPDNAFSYTISEDVTFYAKWKKAYTVKFDPNGGTLTGGIFTNWKQSQQRIKDAHGYYADGLCVVIGKSISLPDKNSNYYGTPVITRDGYEFKGWTATRNGSDVLSGTYKPTRDITLYAKWGKPSSNIDVVRVSFDKTEIDLAVGRKMQLNAKVTPLNATDQTITWSSDNTAVASVDQKGIISAKKYGKAVITARTSNGVTATCTVQTRFADVANAGKSYYKPVYWAVDKGITVVTVNFRPDDSVTRGEFVAFLWRLAGKPKLSAKVNFKDVTASTKFYDAIRWAVGQGIIKGYSDGTFKSENPVTRGETATMIWRYAGKKTPKTKTSPFSDIKASGADSYKAILWGSENGIIKGSNGKFLKNDTCTRGQVVTFLYRYANQ